MHFSCSCVIFVVCSFSLFLNSYAEESTTALRGSSTEEAPTATKKITTTSPPVTSNVTSSAASQPTATNTSTSTSTSKPTSISTKPATTTIINTTVTTTTSTTTITNTTTATKITTTAIATSIGNAESGQEAQPAPVIDEDKSEPSSNQENLESTDEGNKPSNGDSSQKGVASNKLDVEPPEVENSHFLAYLVTIGVLCGVLYVAYHNRKKILGLIVEGRRRQHTRHKGYRKVETADPDDVPKDGRHVIY